MEKLCKKAWNLYADKELIDVQKIPLGFKNTSFLLTTIDGDRFVMKFYAIDFLSDEIIELYSNIVKGLLDDGLPVIEPVLGIDGKYMQKAEGDNRQLLQVTVSRYVEDSSLSEMALDKKVVEELATVLGKFHTSLKKLAVEKKTRVLDPLKTLQSLIEPEVEDQIRDYFQKNLHRPERLDAFVKDYFSEGEEIKRYFERRKEIFSPKNMQLIHGDFNLTNLNVRDGKVLTIFDFDEMTKAPYSFEIGCSVVHLDEGFMFIEDLFEVFIAKYCNGQKASRELIEDIYMFMRYRCYYRISRYFTYYRFSDKQVEHFTKYQEKLNKYKQFDLDEMYEHIGGN